MFEENELNYIEYSELKEHLDEHYLEIEKLRHTFLLSEQDLAPYRNSVGKSKDAILKSIYEADSVKESKGDMHLLKIKEKVDKLSPKGKDYSDKMSQLVNEMVTEIPQQNRVSLTKYVARRKLVLELFDSLLEKAKEQLKGEGRISEDLLHNLIFKQRTDDTENSDLWLVNEDFLFFDGVSEEYIKNLEYNGEKIIKENMTPEELEVFESLGESMGDKRPDILLFPEENKCIIIELKAPDVNVSKHLTQINNYASILMNFTKAQFKCTTFYGYLIGEGINYMNAKFQYPNIQSAYNLGYLFIPRESIPSIMGEQEGSLYTEIIKYSTLLDRAKKRNKIFMKKLGIDSELSSE